MKTYHWKEYGFIGTVPDFARHFGVCKSQTFVNAVRRVSRQVYNCMSAWEQVEYEEKWERVKPLSASVLTIRDSKLDKTKAYNGKIGQRIL